VSTEQPKSTVTDPPALTKEKWTISHKLTLAAILVAVGGAPLGLYLLYVYHPPDVRYEPGTYYRTGDIAITQLKLKNYGHSDAENIKISAKFPEPLDRDVSTSENGVVFKVTSGGKGSSAVTGELDRLVPDQSVVVWFAIKNPQGPMPSAADAFVHEITYKGGKGTAGQPWGWVTWLFLVLDAVLVAFSIFTTRFNVIRFRAYKNELKEIVKANEKELQEIVNKNLNKIEELKESTRELTAKVAARDAVKALAEEIVVALRSPRPRKASPSKVTYFCAPQ
jgi:hypothetical protein